MVFGIVGKIGSGKSEIVKYLKDEYNAISFSCDEIAKKIIKENGLKIYNSEEVFTNTNLQEKIRTELHPLVFKRINENINNFKNKSELLFIIESALPSDNMFSICDKVIYVDSPYDMRVDRLKSSRGYDENKIKQIYDSQKYYDRFYDRADFKIDNSGTIDDLINRIEGVMNEIYIVGK